MRLPSAMILKLSSGCFIISSRPAVLSLSSYSPPACSKNTDGSQGASSTSSTPDDAFEASTRSSISRLRRSDCLFKTSLYSLIFSFSEGSLFIRSA